MWGGDVMSPPPPVPTRCHTELSTSSRRVGTRECGGGDGGLRAWLGPGARALGDSTAPLSPSVRWGQSQHLPLRPGTYTKNSVKMDFLSSPSHPHSQLAATPSVQGIRADSRHGPGRGLARQGGEGPREEAGVRAPGGVLPPEGSYLDCWPPPSEHSETARAAGCCCRRTAAAAVCAAGAAWTCAWSSPRPGPGLVAAADGRVSFETPRESSAGARGDAEGAAGQLVTASTGWGPAKHTLHSRGRPAPRPDVL